MGRSSLTEPQRLTTEGLVAQGFTLDGMCRSVVKLHRGNDHRLVQLDGQQKRALGARR